MPVSAETLRKLMDAGLSGDALLDVVASIDADHKPASRSSGAERQARYRARKDGDVTSDVTRYGTNRETSLPSKEGPHTPKETQPTLPTTQQEKTPKGVQKKGSRLPAGWVLPEGWGQDAIDAGLAAHLIDLEAAKMRDWSLSSAAGVKLDWRATWRNWCREAASRSPPRGSPAQRSQTAQEILKSRRQVNPDDDRPPNRPVLIASR